MSIGGSGSGFGGRGRGDAGGAGGGGSATSADPVLNALDPSEITAGWKGTLHVRGENFNENSDVVIDGGRFPETRYIDVGNLDAELTAEQTGNTGDHSVTVHDIGTGTESNALTLRIKPAR